MPTFVYRAATGDGRILQGTEEAVSAPGLDRMLSGRGLYPLEITRAEGGSPHHQRRGRWPLVARQADATEAVATLAALLGAGLTLDRSLEIAARGAARPDVAETLETARRRVREGGRLADALADSPRLFPPVAVGLVRAGEQGGHLAEAMHRLAEQLERQRALRARLLSAMLYPLLLIGVGVVALLVLLLIVLPQFVELLQDAGAELPRMTSLLLGTVSLLSTTWPVWILSAFALVFLFAGSRRLDAGRELTDTLLLRLPVVGPLRAGHATARLARALATLLASGLPLLPSLEIAAAATGDSAMARQVRGARESVRRGEALSTALQREAAFPYIFVRLVGVGEESGRLDVLLERAAALLEAELERRLERLVSMLEPALILLFGLAVGVVALALLQAIYGIHADAF